MISVRPRPSNWWRIVSWGTKVSSAAEPPTTEDRSKTPVERGYPSNDIEYYVNYPDEPMPPELVEELMIPDEYNPGMDYVPEPY